MPATDLNTKVSLPAGGLPSLSGKERMPIGVMTTKIGNTDYLVFEIGNHVEMEECSDATGVTLYVSQDCAEEVLRIMHRADLSVLRSGYQCHTMLRFKSARVHYRGRYSGHIRIFVFVPVGIVMEYLDEVARGAV